MDFLTMRTTVSSLAGDEDQVQFSTVNVKLYVNWAQAEVARRLELNQKLVVVTTLDAVSTPADEAGSVALPADFAQELHVLWNGYKLNRMDFASIYNGFSSGSLSTSDPSFYTITRANTTAGAPGQRKMIFYPYQTIARVVPGTGLHIFYLAQPADMTADIDVSPLPDICDEAICLYALARCKLQENDLKGYQTIMGDVELRLLSLSTLTTDTDAFSYGVVRDSDSGMYPVMSD